MTTALNAIAFKAQTHPQHRFQSLYGQLNTDALYRAWSNLNKQSAAGIDGVTANQFEQRLPENLHTLAQQLKDKRFRVNDVKRVYIPKANGKERPLGLPAVADKVVQQAVSELLQSIWEQYFQRNSYGYRPHKSAHQAVHCLQLNLQFKGYGYIVEADIKGFFDNMDHTWLMRMLEQRIDDKRLLNLINQWLKARIKEPDDFVVAFQYGHEARAFYRMLTPRLKKFKLEVAPEKTALKRFSRFHPSQHRYFEFLGFRFYWDTDFKGEPRLRRKTAPKKHKAALQSFYLWIKENRHRRLNHLMPQLKRKIVGFRNYFGLPDNSLSVGRIYGQILHSLYKWLNRRSQRRSFTWSGMKEMLRYFGIQPMRVSKRLIAVDWY